MSPLCVQKYTVLLLLICIYYLESISLESIFIHNKVTVHRIAKQIFSLGGYSILSDALLYRTNISLTAYLTPVSHPSLSSSLPPSVYISNRVELFQCITLQSQAGDGRAPPIPLCQTTKAASCFENFPHHANWQRHAFQKPTANLLIIIYLQRPSGCKSCKNHTWYVCSLSC